MYVNAFYLIFITKVQLQIPLSTTRETDWVIFFKYTQSVSLVVYYLVIPLLLLFRLYCKLVLELGQTCITNH